MGTIVYPSCLHSGCSATLSHRDRDRQQHGRPRSTALLIRRRARDTQDVAVLGGVNAKVRLAIVLIVNPGFALRLCDFRVPRGDYSGSAASQGQAEKLGATYSFI